jgi:hypothetical protein
MFGSLRASDFCCSVTVNLVLIFLPFSEVQVSLSSNHKSKMNSLTAFTETSVFSDEVCSGGQLLPSFVNGILS